MIKDKKKRNNYIILYTSVKYNISLPFKAYEEECTCSDKNGDMIW